MLNGPFIASSGLAEPLANMAWLRSREAGAIFEVLDRYIGLELSQNLVGRLGQYSNVLFCGNFAKCMSLHMSGSPSQFFNLDFS